MDNIALVLFEIYIYPDSQNITVGRKISGYLDNCYLLRPTYLKALSFRLMLFTVYIWGLN